MKKMAYKCGNCNVEFLTRKALNKHMVEVHNSIFLEGDERDIKGTQDIVKASPEKYAELDRLSKEAQ